MSGGEKPEAGVPGRLVQQQPRQGAAEAPTRVVGGSRDGETDARDVRKEEITDFGG